MCELKKMERYLGVNLLGSPPRFMKKRIYRAAVSQRLRNTAIVVLPLKWSGRDANHSFPYSQVFLYLKASREARQVNT